MKFKEKGITLIALVITIVVLLILAGITVNLIMDDNGIFTKANQAKEKWAEAEQNEEQFLNNLSNEINNTNGKDTKKTENEKITDLTNTTWSVKNVEYEGILNDQSRTVGDVELNLAVNRVFPFFDCAGNVDINVEINGIETKMASYYTTVDTIIPPGVSAYNLKDGTIVKAGESMTKEIPYVLVQTVLESWDGTFTITGGEDCKNEKIICLMSLLNQIKK